ncbi:hypothetical protein OBBRIDRAFT_826661 [Obba rivulosa]|uniref:Uncharacterized protein n=1 Tax=Obba rivulosa TaxID=1052685 RepID=A0A8E2AVV9_9APHY|nr:hypothetical protein OBBRIDRAFT_826661 [Obba rivulosa]
MSYEGSSLAATLNKWTTSASTIRQIRITRGAFFGPRLTETSKAFLEIAYSGQDIRPHFAPYLADVLEKANSLLDLEIIPWADPLLSNEPRILRTLVTNPPARKLQLEFLRAPTLEALRPLRFSFPASLSLNANSMVSELQFSAREAIADILANNVNSLYELSLTWVVPEYLLPWSKETPPTLPFVRGLQLNMVMTTPDRLASAFPNLYHLSVRALYEGQGLQGDFNALFMNTETTLWPELKSLHGTAALVQALAKHQPQLRQIHVSDVITSNLGMDELCVALRDHLITSLRLAVSMAIPYVDEGREYAGNGEGIFSPGAFWTKLANAFPHVRSMTLHLSTMTSSPDCNFRVISGPSVQALTSLRALRSVSLFFPFPAIHRRALGMIRRTSPESLQLEQNTIRLWFETIPSLEYLEVAPQEMLPGGHCWWKRQRVPEEGNGFRVVRIPKEECLDAEEEYTWSRCI